MVFYSSANGKTAHTEVKGGFGVYGLLFLSEKIKYYFRL